MRLVSSWREALAPREIRLLAYLLDSFVIYSVALTGGYVGAFLAAAITSAQGAPAAVVDAAAVDGMGLGFGFWAFAAVVVNFVVIQGLTSASVGKWICGLKVVRADGAPVGLVKSFWRTVLYVPSVAPLHLGFLSIYSNEQAQCWHDRVCETLVVKSDARVTAFATGPVIPLPAPEAHSGHEAA